jgi:L-amino acid N-acyltransferase YncA
MKLNEIELQSFVMAELNTYDLNGLGINSEIAKKEIKDELLEELEDLNSDDTKQARLDYFKVKDATKEDYSEKRLNIKDGKEVIYGIRNMGGNPDIPFIQLRPNFELSSKEESLEIYEMIKEEFKVFEPLYLSFQTVSKINADFYGSVHMVTKTHELINKEAWTLKESISFEDITDDSYYEWYKKGYEEFHSDFPELKTKVTVNSASSMEDSLEQGLLKFVNLDGERIGLIAGEKSNFLGHTGVYFHEIYISKKWKGKGLAKAIQRKFIQDFCNELEFVWGTIDSTNLPSYKTAYSNGRRPIRHECFINLK